MVLDGETLLIVEWVAATLGVINIGLLIFRSVWNFPFGIAMVALYIFVFFEERLYAEAGLQVFFILAQLWGWWLWLKVGGEDGVIVTGMDGNKAALQSILDGKLAMSVETNPRFGPLLFDTIGKYLACEPIPAYVEVQDRVFDSKNVDQKAVDEAF